MPNISNAESAWLMAQSKFRKWQIRFEQEWHAPHIDTAAAAAWSQIPPEVKRELRKMNPEAYDIVEAKYGTTKI
jgi:hypothetical protein